MFHTIAIQSLSLVPTVHKLAAWLKLSTCFLKSHSVGGFHYFRRFGRRFKVQNIRSGFNQSPNTNFSMRSRSGNLLDCTPNHRSGPGSNPVLEVQEPDRGQSSSTRKKKKAVEHPGTPCNMIYACIDPPTCSA